MPVQNPNKQYLARRPINRRIRDALSGIDRIRARGVAYLPKPDTQCEDARYNDYKGRTYYVNLPLRTVTTLAGLLNNKDPEVELPTQMQYLMDNVDGSGGDLDQQIKDNIDEVLSLGCAAILVLPKPAPEMGVNRANADALMPTITAYKDEQIINERVNNGKLTMVVLREHEYVPATDDEFTNAVAVSFRVLTLDEGGVKQRIYTGQDKAATVESCAFFEDEYIDIQNMPGNWSIEESYLTLANNQPMTEIPLYFIGSVNNDATRDPSPILNICDLMLAYYRMSADEQLNVHLASGGFVTVATRLEPKEWQEFNGTFEINSSFGTYFVGESGSMNFVQAAECMIVNTSMANMLKNAIAVGAQYISDAITDKTATEARINNSTSTSQLTQIARNTSDAYTKAFKMIAAILGETGEAYLSISTEFFDDEVSPEMIRSMAEAVLKGTMAQTEFLLWQKKVGIIDEDRTVDDARLDLDEAALNSMSMPVVTNNAE